jgi:signal transduction histidine kinase
LQISLESAGPLKIEADAALIHRMIANLLDNELKHLPAGRVITSRLQAVNGYAELIVEDNGLGFAPEVCPHLFERRVKGKDSRGHGLGLAFVEAVVRTHSGTVDASNRSQGGAIIRIRLPLSSRPSSESTASRLVTVD